MKNSRVMLFLILFTGTAFSQAPKSGYDQAVEWFEKKHYVQAVEVLKDYMDENPNDQRASELLENMYDKYSEFLAAYIEGKDYYNKKLYLKTIGAFSNALKIGFSDKLQFYLTECIRTIFDIEHGFLPGGISDNGGTVTVEWESALLTNASVTFIKSDNIPLLNMIYYLNKNKIPLPHLEKYFTQGNVFKSLSIQGTSFTFNKEQPADAYIVMIHPRTSEDVRSQPIIYMVVANPPALENEYLLIEPVKDVPALPVYTNIYTPGAPLLSNTNKLVTLAKFSNIITNNILTNLFVQTIPSPGGIFPWWWLALLAFIIALAVYMSERKRRKRVELMRKWKLESSKP